MKLDFPIIQAPMAGGITSPKLVAEVSNAGALGSLGAGYMQPEAIEKSINEIKSLSSKPFNVNLFIPPKTSSEKFNPSMIKTLKSLSEQELHKSYHTPEISEISFEEQVDVILKLKVPIFSFTFGLLPQHLVKKFRDQNTFLIGTATSLEEAIQLEEMGIDAIVCQGYEAGGHRGGFSKKDSLYTLMALLNLCSGKIKKPLIAAGGIANGKSIAAALILGAKYAQIGTAFLTTLESTAHPAYKKALLDKKGESTIVTNVITGKFARGIENKLIDSLKDQKISSYPKQHFLTKDIREEAKKKNRSDLMSLWAGQGYHLCEEISAKELVERLSKELKEAL